MRACIGRLVFVAVHRTLPFSEIFFPLLDAWVCQCWPRASLWPDLHAVELTSRRHLGSRKHTRAIPRSTSRQRPRTEALSFGIVKWFEVYNKRHRKQASPFSLLAAAYTQCFDGFATGLGSGRCQRLFGTLASMGRKAAISRQPKATAALLLLASCLLLSRRPAFSALGALSGPAS